MGLDGVCGWQKAGGAKQVGWWITRELGLQGGQLVIWACRGWLTVGQGAQNVTRGKAGEKHEESGLWGASPMGGWMEGHSGAWEWRCDAARLVRGSIEVCVGRWGGLAGGWVVAVGFWEKGWVMGGLESGMNRVFNQGSNHWMEAGVLLGMEEAERRGVAARREGGAVKEVDGQVRVAVVGSSGPRKQDKVGRCAAGRRIGALAAYEGTLGATLVGGRDLGSSRERFEGASSIRSRAPMPAGLSRPEESACPVLSHRVSNYLTSSSKVVAAFQALTTRTFSYFFNFDAGSSIQK
ncbi:hypothetical protein Tco_1375898 [Tanacetum coccineum]